jgi:hypothetical protein
MELVSAGVLMWLELRHGQKSFERAEHVASQIGGRRAFLLEGSAVVARPNLDWSGAMTEPGPWVGNYDLSLPAGTRYSLIQINIARFQF